MAISEHYDVLIVGRTVAGLMAATLLAKRRLRVRVLDVGFSPEPDLPVFGLETTPLLHPLLDEMGLVHDVRTRIFGPPTAVNIALSDRRFAFPPDARKRAQILGEVFPDEQDPLLELFSFIERFGPKMDSMLDGELDFSADGFRATRGLQRLAEESGLDDLVGQTRSWSENQIISDFVKALLAVSGRLDGGPDYMTPAAIRSLWHLCFGIPRIRDGRRGLEDLLAQKLLTSGGTIEEHRIADQFDIRRKRIKSIQTTDGAVFGGDAVIVSGGMNTLNMLAGEVIGAVETATLNRVAIPAYERPQPFLDPCGWIPRLGHAPVLARPQDGTVALLSVDTGSLPIEQLVPATNIARSEAIESPWSGPAQLDTFGFCSSALRSPLKNTLLIGESMMPGLGIEGACLTAYQAAEAVTASKASRWPFGGKL